MRFALALIALACLGIAALVLAAIRAAKAGDDGADELAEGDWPHVPRGAGASSHSPCVTEEGQRDHAR